MQDLIPSLAFGGLAFLGTLSVPYWLLAGTYLARWRRDAVPTPAIATPPVTFFRPIKRDTPRLLEGLEKLAQALRPEDHLLLGVEAGSEVAERAARWRDRFPEHEITLVACEPGHTLNPKVSKLVQMTPHARHDAWIISDSEALLDRPFLEALRAEWAGSCAAAVTTGYRSVGLETWTQQLDAAAVLLTLWPGLACLRRFGPLRLTLGACTAVHGADLAAVGGWAAFGEELAEDNRLGRALADAGRTVRLSTQVATLASDTLSWRDYWRHQRRVAVTYRVANPGGFAGSIITHGITLGLLLAFWPHPAAPAVGGLLALASWLVRWLTARNFAKILDFPIPRLAWVVLGASLVESVCWAMAWFSRRIWWAGQCWCVSPSGRLQAAVEPLATPQEAMPRA